jgi:ABC-2 type transport system permease protein
VSALLTTTLRQQQRAFLGWAAGLAAVAAMYAAFYPSIQASAADFQGYMDKLPEAIRSLIGNDFTTSAGYLRSETFSTLGPILMLVFAIGAGSRAIAGEEEGHTLDLLLSTPVRRRQVLVDKWASMTLTALALVSVLGATIALIGPPFQLHIGLVDLASACLMLFLVAIAFGSISLAVGAYTGHRGLANGITGALAVAAYVVNVLASSVDALSVLRPLSPFRWYLEPDPLVTGLTAENVLVLAGITLVSTAVALLVFERRDLQA